MIYNLRCLSLTIYKRDLNVKVRQSKLNNKHWWTQLKIYAKIVFWIPYMKTTSMKTEWHLTVKKCKSRYKLVIPCYKVQTICVWFKKLRRKSIIQVDRSGKFSLLTFKVMIILKVLWIYKLSIYLNKNK